ncbi:hypothetical protein [Paenibacillus polymyxa]|nr:hypothetical protein [Paenibacillus polymyxa]
MIEKRVLYQLKQAQFAVRPATAKKGDGALPSPLHLFLLTLPA